MRLLPLVLAAVLAACATSRQPVANLGNREVSVAPGCEEGMPPVREFDEPFARAVGVYAHSLDVEPIRRAVRENQEDLRRCYERGLLRDPNVAGRVDIRWRIERDGTVGDVELAERPTLADACVVVCVMHEVATWTFPTHTSEDGFLVTYPFRFGDT